MRTTSRSFWRRDWKKSTTHIPKCWRCQSQAYKITSRNIGQMEHCPWGQSLGHSLLIRSEKIWHQIPWDYRGDDGCTWPSIATHIRNFIRSARLRDLNLLQCVRYVNVCQFSWLLRHKYVLPIRDDELRRINSAMFSFIWSESIYRVPLSTLYLAQRERGLDVKDTKAKCLTLFLNRCIQLLHRDATLTAEWITLLNRTVAPGSPPNIRSTPADVKYLWLFFDRSATSLQLSLPPLGEPQTIRAIATFWTRFAVDSNPCQISKYHVGNNLGNNSLLHI